MLFMSCVGHAFASVHCLLEKADLLALVRDVYCVLSLSPCGILGQVWYLIVSITDLCRLSYFVPLAVDNCVTWSWCACSAEHLFEFMLNHMYVCIFRIAAIIVFDLSR